MTAVIDASALVAALVDSGTEGEWADEVTASGPLLAPELILVETANTLRRLESSGAISRLEANSAFRDLMRLELDLLPFAPFAERVWELRGSLTSYDAWYVAVAEAFEYPLATLDRSLTRAAGPACEFTMPVPSDPS